MYGHIAIMFYYSHTSRLKRKRHVKNQYIPFPVPQDMTPKMVAETFVAYLHGRDALDNLQGEEHVPRRLGPWHDRKHPQSWNLTEDGDIYIFFDGTSAEFCFQSDSPVNLRYSTMVSLFKLTYPVEKKVGQAKVNA